VLSDYVIDHAIATALLISSIVRHAGCCTRFSAWGCWGSSLPTRNKLVILDGNGLVDFRLGWADCNLEHEVNHGSLGSGPQDPVAKSFVAGAFARPYQLRVVVLALLATFSGVVGARPKVHHSQLILQRYFEVKYSKRYLYL